jgi:SAM-dependent methyltransferase
VADDRLDDVAAGYDHPARRADGDLDAAASPWGDSHFQRHYAWPATRAALPDVEGLDVLLAGCGRGDHVDWILANGAAVTGVDASRAAIERAHERSAGDDDGGAGGAGAGAGVDRAPATEGNGDGDGDGEGEGEGDPRRRAAFLPVVGNVIYFIQSDRPGHCGILAGHCSFVSAPTSAFLSVS